MPFILLGLGASAGALVSIFIPETAYEELPDTVEEAEEFGQGQKLFVFPGLRRRKIKQQSKEAQINVKA